MPNFLPTLHKLTSQQLNDADTQVLQQQFNDIKNWKLFLHEAELYAVSCHIFKHIQEYHLCVPEDVLLSLKGLVMRHKLVAKARHKTVGEIVAIFSKHNVPIVALKGLALAPMIYSQDNLRPMRDMDILVPRGKEALAGKLLTEIGFDLPEDQPSKYMRDTHQLPNATKTVNGFTISVEVHHDALSRDVTGYLFYEDIQPNLQEVKWGELTFLTLGYEQMLHQVTKHMAGLHPGAVLKLINVMDVVLYAEQYIDKIDWDIIKKDYGHIINSLQCLHLIMPLSDELSVVIGGVEQVEVDGIGEIMQPLSAIMNKNNGTKMMLKQLFLPSDWWLHLYYNHSLTKSLAVIKLVKHPLTLSKWFAARFLSRLMGG